MLITLGDRLLTALVLPAPALFAAQQAMGLVFRTPPMDDTGKPHVLEHSLLQGSKRFPVQHPGPFSRLSSGSLATFMNAYTYPDRTLYPVSSANQQEFYNLVRESRDALLAP